LSQHLPALGIGRAALVVIVVTHVQRRSRIMQ
jgi:hypothetical protein